MRVAWICVVGLTGCAQIFGLDSPSSSPARDGSIDGARLDAANADCARESFDSGLDNMLWEPFTEGMETLQVSNGRLEITLDSAPGSAYSGIDTRQPLAASVTGVQVEIVQPSTSGPTETALVMFASQANQLVLAKDSDMVHAIVKVGGTNQELSTKPWDATFRFFRIERASDNKVTFSISSDGSMWSALATATVAFANQNVKGELYAGHYMQAQPSTVAFDNFVFLTATCKL